MENTTAVEKLLSDAGYQEFCQQCARERLSVPSRADATAIKASHNIVTTVGASSGVLLPNGEIGDDILVYNATGTNALTVYPPTSSATINQLSAWVGMHLSPYTAVRLKKTTATTWHWWLSA